jgi:hypothetical protein
MLVGTAGSERSDAAWLQVYRSLDHGRAAKKCRMPKLASFPTDVQDFAEMFVYMQGKRHESDYDPTARVFKTDVMVDIATVADVIPRFNAVPVKHRRAFAVWVLMNDRAS